MVFPKLPNFRSDFLVIFLWAGSDRVEPANKLFVHHAGYVIDGVTIVKPRQNSSRLGFIFIRVLIKINACWIMAKQERRRGIEQLAVFCSQPATFFNNLFTCAGHVRSALLHPLYTWRHRNNPRLVPHIQQPPDGFPSVVAVVEGAFVYVHADEFVG
jgi:hypothetical protein